MSAKSYISYSMGYVVLKIKEYLNNKPFMRWKRHKSPIWSLVFVIGIRDERFY